MTRWQIFSAVALRKLPEIKPKLDVIETRVQEILDRYEVAISKLSKFELEHIDNLKEKDGESVDVVVKETAQDKLDRWVKEKSEFTFAPYDDRLSKIQYLFIKSKFGTDIKDQWLLPQAIYDSQQDSTLLDTARRALKDHLNIVNGYKIVSPIPSSNYNFRYPKKVVKLTGYDGAQVFYLKAHLDIPNKQVLEAVDESKNDRLKWVTKDEIVGLASNSYRKGLVKGLLHEERVDVKRILIHAAKYAAEEQMRKEKLHKQLLKAQA